MQQTTFDGRKNEQVRIQPNIGLDAGARQSVVEMLNLLLADEAVLSLKTRRADGQASELDAAQLQNLYDIQYQQINGIANEIAERVQILGGSQRHNAEALIGSARLEGELNAVPGIVSLLADHEAVIRFLREDAQRCAEMYEDRGTFALLVSAMRTHEKMAWLLRSNIAMEQFANEQ